MSAYAPRRARFFLRLAKRHRLSDPRDVGEVLADEKKTFIFPAVHYVMPEDQRATAIRTIREEMDARVAELRGQGKLLEAQRLEGFLACRSVVAEGRSFPVSVEYLGKPSREAPWDLAGAAIERVRMAASVRRAAGAW